MQRTEYGKNHREYKKKVEMESADKEKRRSKLITEDMIQSAQYNNMLVEQLGFYYQYNGQNNYVNVQGDL